MKQFFKIRTLLLLAILGGVANLQLLGEAIDLRFNAPTVNCTPNPDQFCVTVQVKTATGSPAGVKIGNSTIYLTYNTAAINTPTVTALNFGNSGAIADGYGYNPQSGYLETGTLGEINYNIIYGSGPEGTGAAAITETLDPTTWKDAFQVCFSIVSNTQSANLAFSAQYTGFNKSTNSPTDPHTSGTWANLSAPSLACPVAGGMVMALKTYLEGPYVAASMTMNTTLTNSPNLVPTAQPYNIFPWNYNGTENYSTMPTGMVDWVYVTALTLSGSVWTVVERHAAVLKSDGTIVDAPSVASASSTGVTFSSLTAGNAYYFAVKHRNHLGVVSATPVTVSASGGTYDYTNASQVITIGAATYTQQKAAASGGKFVMRSGNSDANAAINSLDYIAWKGANGQSAQYRKEDFDMNRNVNSLDYIRWKANNPNSGVSLPN